MRFTYTPRGVCSQRMQFDITDGHIHDLKVVGGCNGNLQGIARLVEGMPANEAISRLRGIRCGMKPTSCPDQLATALEGALQKINAN